MRADGKPFKKEINRLKHEADSRAAALGHRLMRWIAYTGESPRDEYIAAFCPKCKGGVIAATHDFRLPNGYVQPERTAGIHGSVLEWACGPDTHIQYP